MLAVGEMCFENMWTVEKGFGVLALGEMCFEGMGAVKKGVEVLALGLSTGEMCF